MNLPLQNKVALVAGATRGAGRAQRSEYNRPETIEETAEIVTQAGGRGIAVPTDHLEPAQVQALVQLIERQAGRLDVLVNDIWGGEQLAEWHKPLWEHSLEKGLRLLRLAVDTHLITSHYALPLLMRHPGGLVVEMNDGTVEFNQANYRLSAFYDLAKTSIGRLAWAQAQELKPHQATAVSLTPGWMRSEMMLDHFGVTEASWPDATAKEPHFVISESPRFVGRAVAALAADADVQRWNGQSLSSAQLAKVYGFNDVDGSRPDCWRYLAEVEKPGKPADATGYR